jgi:hypothetical protein
MPNTKTPRSESTKAVTLDLLQQAGQPLPAKEIAKRVIESGRCAGLKGKTPDATISAMLAVGSKPGGPFKRVGKGTYTLADPTPTGTTPPDAVDPAEKPGPVARTPRKRQPKASTASS